MTVCLGASAEAIDAHAAALWARHRLGEAAARWGSQLGTAATWLRLVARARVRVRDRVRVRVSYLAQP